MNKEEVLQKFYEDWLKWVQEGARSHAVFGRDKALCESLLFWNIHRNRVIPGLPYFTLEDLLCRHFERAGLSRVYPFNTDRADFIIEFYAEECHSNTQRLAFVEGKLK